MIKDVKWLTSCRTKLWIPLRNVGRTYCVENCTFRSADTANYYKKLKQIHFSSGKIRNGTGPYPGLSLSTPVQRKCWICLYKRYIVLHLNRLELKTQSYIRSLIQHLWVFYLNLWEQADACALKIWLNGWCCFALVLL